MATAPAVSLFGGRVEQLDRHYSWYHRTIWLMLWSILGIALVLPWLVHVFDYVKPSLHLEIPLVSSVAGVDSHTYLNSALYQVRHARDWVLGLLALSGIVVIIFRRNPVRLLFIWMSAMLLLFNFWWWRLWPVRLDLVVICLFVPVSVLAGYGLVWIQKIVRRCFSAPAMRYLTFLVTMLLCAWGLRETWSIVPPVTVLASKADMEAITWIKEHVPSNARFLINVELWQGKIYRGVDGGAWIALLSGRETILPPITYAWGDRGYFNKVSGLALQVRTLRGCEPDFWSLIEEQRITHIYFGTNGGALQSSRFEGCLGVMRIYDKSGVQIYLIDQVN